MKVYCPYCKKEVNYRIEKREVKEFKGVEIDTFENVGICEVCNNDLYINDIEKANNERIYKLYNEKENIIKPQDIISFREKYDISQRELTKILGFGKMTINRYERGDIPTKSQSDYIKLLIENEDKFISKVEDVYKNNIITEKTYNKIISKINKTENIKKNKNELIKGFLVSNLSRTPDIYNGYKELDIEKVENIISYIASKTKNLTITSLNKYLWYIDMLSFNRRSVAITGLTYQNQQYGPVVIDQSYDLLALLDDKYKSETKEIENGHITNIISNGNYDLNEVSESEKKIIDEVIKILKNKKVSEISELSHKEDGWKKTNKFEEISFEYAMNLNLIK